MGNTKEVTKPDLQLSGEDGNIFFIFGRASKVAKQNDIDFAPIREEAMQGDYDHALRTMMKYFNVL